MYLGIAAFGAVLVVIGIVLWFVAGHFGTQAGRDRAHAIAVGFAVFGLVAVLIGVIASVVSA